MIEPGTTFQAEHTSDDFVTELDLAATRVFNEKFSAQAKYASFDADDRFDDTDKIWFTLRYKL